MPPLVNVPTGDPDPRVAAPRDRNGYSKTSPTLSDPSYETAPRKRDLEVDVEQGGARYPRQLSLISQESQRTDVNGYRRKFKRSHCLFHPKFAMNTDKCEPWATLQVTVKKAHNLVAADNSGLSDPFVTLQLNGEDTGMQTQVINGSLAPVWDYTFDEIDIYHPNSFLSVTVVDKDFGNTGLGMLDFLSLDDDFIGWADIQLCALPLNVVVNGWFELGREEDYLDSLAGRRRAFGEAPPTGAGCIELVLLLRVHRPLDELFALMLPAPSLGEDLPVLDLADAVKTYSELAADGAKISQVLDYATSRLSSYYVTKVVILVFFIWYPELILSSIIALIAVVIIIVWFCWPHWQEKAKRLADPAQPLLADDFLVRRDSGFPSPRRRSPTPRDGSPKKKKKQDDPPDPQKMASTLKMLQGFLDADAILNIRRVQGILTSVLQFLRTCQTLVREAEHRDMRILLVALALLALSVAAAWFRQYMGVFFAVVLSIVAIFVCLQEWIPVKFASACFRYTIDRGERHVLQSAVGDAAEIYLSRAAARCISTMGERVWTRENKSIPLTREHHEQTHKVRHHQLEVSTFMEPTWCHTCGKFIWGIESQGFECIFCSAPFCQECAHHFGSAGGPLECSVRENMKKAATTKSVMDTPS